MTIPYFNSVGEFSTNFSPFANRIERLLLKYWMVTFFIPYLFWKIENVLYDVLNSQFGQKGHEIFIYADAIYLAVFLFLLISVYFANIWVANIPKIFLYLQYNKIFPDQNKLLSSLNQYQQSLVSRYRLLVILPLVSTVMLYFLLITGFGDFRFESFAEEFILEITAIIWAYLIGAYIWVYFVTGNFLRKLPKLIPLALHPGNPDKCAGINKLGDLCFGMVVPLLIGIIAISIFGIGDEIILGASLGLAPLLNAFLFVCVIPLTIIAFIIPINSLHEEMVKQRDEYFHVYTLRLMELEEKLEDSILKHKTQEFEKIVKQLDSLKSTVNVDYPVWPIDKNILLKFITPQLLPVIGLFVQINPQVKDALSALFGIVSSAK